MRSRAPARHAAVALTGVVLALGLGGCEGLCTGVPFLDAFFCRFNEPPRAGLQVTPSPAYLGVPATLDASGSTDPDGGRLVTVQFDPLGTGAFRTDGLSPDRFRTTATFPALGTFSPAVRVYDAEGASDTATTLVEVLARPGNLPPVPEIRVSTTRPDTDDPVSLTGLWSDADGSVARLDWDLDGDGTFETGRAVRSSETSDLQITTFTTPGPRTVTLRVVDNEGALGTARAELDVVPANRPPIARLAIDPNPARVGQTVTFLGHESEDPEGGPLTFRWDLDGVGILETNTGETPFTSRTYETPGDITITLRAFDEGGERDDDQQVLSILPADDGESSSPGRARAAAASRPVTTPFTARISATRVVGRVPALRREGSRQRLRGLRLSGRLTGGPAGGSRRARSRARALVGDLLRARWRGTLDARHDPRTGERRVTLLALADGRRRRGARAPRTCLRLRFADGPGRRPVGGFTVLGGTGAARRLAGSGTFAFATGPGADATATGTLIARRTKARGLPRACRALAGARAR